MRRHRRRQVKYSISCGVRYGLGTLFEPNQLPRERVQGCRCACPPCSGKPEAPTPFPPEPLVQGRKPVTALAGDAPLTSSFDNNDLQALRSRIREHRAALDAPTRARAAEHASRHALELPQLKPARRVAAYIAVNGELDPAPLLAGLREQGKEIYLPVLGAAPANGLQFALFPEHGDVRPNRLGIPEPIHASEELIRATELDVVFAPLVAFDTRGNRLGMGGGYYDRTFAFLGAGGKGPFLAGLGYAFQRVAALPAQAWDIPLRAVATDEALFIVHATQTYQTSGGDAS